MEYFDAFQDVNNMIVSALRQCVELMSKVHPPGEDRTTWEKTLYDIEGIIAINEKTVQKKQELLH
jgi:hypothetical protein